MSMAELETYIKKVLLENAINYDGSTKANATMGAVMRDFPEYRGKGFASPRSCGV